MAIENPISILECPSIPDPYPLSPVPRPLLWLSLQPGKLGVQFNQMTSPGPYWIIRLDGAAKDKYSRAVVLSCSPKKVRESCTCAGLPDSGWEEVQGWCHQVTGAPGAPCRAPPYILCGALHVPQMQECDAGLQRHWFACRCKKALAGRVLRWHCDALCGAWRGVACACSSNCLVMTRDCSLGIICDPFLVQSPTEWPLPKPCRALRRLKFPSPRNRSPHTPCHIPSLHHSHLRPSLPCAVSHGVAALPLPRRQRPGAAELQRLAGGQRYQIAWLQCVRAHSPRQLRMRQLLVLADLN